MALTSASPLIHVVAATVLAALICAVYGPIVWGALSGPSDYTAQVQYAELLYQKARLSILIFCIKPSSRRCIAPG